MQFQESLRAQFWVLSCFSSTLMMYNQWFILSWHSYRFVCRWYSFVSHHFLKLGLFIPAIRCQYSTGLSKLQPRFSTLPNISSCWSHVRGTRWTTPAITINGQMLETVSTFKYLGLLLTLDLSWSKHTEEICTKTKRKCWACYTVDFTNMLNRRLFSSYTHQLYSPTWNTQNKSGIHTWKRSGSTWWRVSQKNV